MKVIVSWERFLQKSFSHLGLSWKGGTHPESIAYVLIEPCPDREEKLGGLYARKKWKEDDYLCRGHILNLVADNIYSLYSDTQTARELWIRSIRQRNLWLKNMQLVGT